MSYNRAYKHNYDETHREEKAAYNRAYRETHREKIAACREPHRDNAQRKAEACVRSRAYRASHLEERRAYDRAYRKAHLEQCRAAIHAHQKAHLQDYLLRAAKREALKRGATVGPIDLEAIKVRDRMRCCICGKRVNGKLKFPHPDSLSFDHSHPLSLHGPHTQENIRVAHLRCNFRRGVGRLPVQMILV